MLARAPGIDAQRLRLTRTYLTGYPGIIVAKQSTSRTVDSLGIILTRTALA